jgi:hypothetical protein
VRYYTLWGEWCPALRRVVYLVSNSISAEDEDFTIFRNVGNHTTVLLRIQVLGRVVSGFSDDRNTFIFSVNSISAEDERFTIFRNVGNHTTMLLRIQVLGRVVPGVSEDHNTFRFSVKRYFS